MNLSPFFNKSIVLVGREVCVQLRSFKGTFTSSDRAGDHSENLKLVVGRSSLIFVGVVEVAADGYPLVLLHLGGWLLWLVVKRQLIVIVRK